MQPVAILKEPKLIAPYPYPYSLAIVSFLFVALIVVLPDESVSDGNDEVYTISVFMFLSHCVAPVRRSHFGLTQ